MQGRNIELIRVAASVSTAWRDDGGYAGSAGHVTAQYLAGKRTYSIGASGWVPNLHQ